MPFLCFQLTRKAKVTTAVSPISLPRDREMVIPGMLCSVAGWGHLGMNMSRPRKLQEVELEVQRAEKCTSRYKYYRTTTQMCAGDARKRKSSFKVRSLVLSMQSLVFRSGAVGMSSVLCPQPVLLSNLYLVSPGDGHCLKVPHEQRLPVGRGGLSGPDWNLRTNKTLISARAPTETTHPRVAGRTDPKKVSSVLALSAHRVTPGARSCVMVWPRALCPMEQRMGHLQESSPESQAFCLGSKKQWNSMNFRDQTDLSIFPGMEALGKVVRS